MKLALLFLCCCYFSVSDAQIKYDTVRSHYHYYLVSKKGKHTHYYYEGTPLKIYYNDSSVLLKATGRLFIDDSSNIRLERKSGKLIRIINPGSIISVRRWKGPNLVAVSIVGTVGAFAAIAGLSKVNSPNGNIGDAFLAFLGITDLYVVTIDLAGSFISGWLSVRSVNRGFHFYIKKVYTHR